MVFMSPLGELPPAGKSFREAYCARHGIPLERFEVDLFLRSLPFRARLLRPLLTLFQPHYFCIDRSFVRSIAEARSPAVLLREIKEYRYDSRNMTFARNRLRLRLSTNRLLDAAREIMPHLTAASAERSVSTPPFGRS